MHEAGRHVRLMKCGVVQDGVEQVIAHIRSGRVGQAAVDAGKTLGDLSLDEMEALWQAQKKH